MQVDTDARYTWDDVLSVQRGLIEDREAEVTKGLKGFWHKGVHRLGSNSESFQAWLKLLPTQSHYLSVLCGGFTLLLGVRAPDKIVNQPCDCAANVSRLHIVLSRSAKVFKTS